MKVTIMGYSGSGKSTLARKISEKYNIDVLHLDKVQWLPGWETRSKEEKISIIGEYLDSHTSWVIDGNYTKYHLDRRLDESDKIILLLFNPIRCYFRAKRRYKIYKDKTRPDMTEGCNEKFDKEFKKWIFFDGRTKAIKENYKNIYTKYSKKVIILRNQKDIDKYIASLDANLKK